MLEARFPIVKRIAGDDFFAGMARAFVAEELPRSPVLMLYGVRFPQFIAHFETAADVPYLPDVAQLEWLQHEVTNAADAVSIGPAELAVVPPEAVAGLKLRLHPSLRLFASNFPALTIWELNATPGDVVARKLSAKAEYALLLRPALKVEIRRIPREVFEFAAALNSGSTLATAAVAGESQAADFDLPKALASLIAMGAVVGFELSGGQIPSV